MTSVQKKSGIEYVRYWLWLGLILMLIMVSVGGVTRLTGSGLSIVEWKVISGIIPPLNDREWNDAFAEYKKFPEYKLLNKNISLSQFKNLFFWEYAHRLLGRIMGIAFLFPFLFFLSKHFLSRVLITKLIILFFLGAVQGGMGWYMVKSGLVSMPHVSHFRLALHQCMAMIMIAHTYWTILSLKPGTAQRTHKAFNWAVVCLSVLSVQMILGAFVSGLKAGYSYTDFPFMENSFFPSLSAVSSKPFLHNGVVLQFVHRWFAFVVVALWLGFFWFCNQQVVLNFVKKVFALGLLQLILGITTLVLKVPLALGVLHQLVAFLIFLLLIKIIYEIRYSSTDDRSAIETGGKIH